MQDPVAVTAELDAEQAWALAQLLKRLGWSDCRRLAEDDAQADLTMQAAERLRSALARTGYAPR